MREWIKAGWLAALRYFAPLFAIAVVFWGLILGVIYLVCAR